MADKKSKNLSKGEQRRLSMAEELVHGPQMILLDEPLTDLDDKDISIILSGVLRELVNQDRTVIATLHQVNNFIALYRPCIILYLYAAFC